MAAASRQVLSDQPGLDPALRRYLVAAGMLGSSRRGTWRRRGSSGRRTRDRSTSPTTCCSKCSFRAAAGSSPGDDAGRLDIARAEEDVRVRKWSGDLISKGPDQ
jgi:hypothetical protein